VISAYVKLFNSVEASATASRANQCSGRTMKMANSFVKAVLYFLIIFLLSTGCGQKPEQHSTVWLPRSVGGPIEIRPLPPAHLIADDYQRWLDSSPGRKLRLYKAVLQGAEKQENLHFKVGPSEGPIGNPIMTSATFTYNDGTNGTYIMRWMEEGHHSQDVITVGNTPRTALLKLLQTRDTAHPRLKIMGIEGFPSPGTYSATDETAVP
jgi:hypothetical protein